MATCTQTRGSDSRQHSFESFGVTSKAFGRFLVCLLLWSGTLTHDALGESTPLTTARQVHDLPPEEARKALPVHLTGWVTYYQPGERNFFVTDGSGAVFILVNARYPFPIHAGDRVEVYGKTQASFRSIVAAGAQVRVLGPGQQATAKPATYKQLVSGELDCQRVRLRGVVRSATVENHGAGAVAQMRVLMPGGIVQVYVHHYERLALHDLIDAEVEVSGVAAADFNEMFQSMRPKLFASESSDVRILSQPILRPASLPATEIDHLMESRYVVDRSQRVRVRGVVTAFEPGNFLVIRNGKLNLFALTRQIDTLEAGSVVDVVGFADGHAYSAVLEDAQIFPTGSKQEVKPQPVSYSDAMSGRFSDAFVSMRGRVLSELQGEFSNTLVIDVDRHPVSIVLQTKGRATLPHLEPGTAVEVRGICRVTPTAWGKPLLFRLDLRGANDLTVLGRPSWWTAKNLSLAGAGLLSVTALVLVWVVVLRRRVADQTEQIERSIRIERERSRLLERINSQASLDELLEDICSSVSAYIPGARCGYVLQTDLDRGTANPGHKDKLLYESALADAKGRRLGSFHVSGPAVEPLSTDQLQTLAKGAGLMNLAVNQRLLYDELNYRSTHDQLTDLPNRRLADSRLEEALAAARAGGRVGVIYIDVDRFKEVNDRYGHKTGDLFLQQIAARLRGAIRSSDLLARIGGDEFLLIATSLRGMEDGAAYRARLLRCFSDDFSLNGVRIGGSASIGLALYPDHGTTPEELKRHADTAMYAAKYAARSESAQAGKTHLPVPADQPLQAILLPALFSQG